VSEYIDPWLQLFRWKKLDRPTAFDSAANCVAALPRMKSLGYNTAIRYYDHTVHDHHPSSKLLSVHEAVQVMAAGFDLVTVYESTNNMKFMSGEADGRLHGKRAGWYATNKIHQPMGSAIYFAVDTDIGDHEIKKKTLPYFRGVAAGLRETCLGGIPYRIGVYGSGETCAAVLDAGLAQHAWLANAKGWAGFKTFENSGRWHLKQQHTKTLEGGFAYAFDPNYVGARDIGQFNSRDIFV
jgi:hypothetical protein